MEPVRGATLATQRSSDPGPADLVQKEPHDMSYHTPGPWTYDEATGEVHHNDGDFMPLVATVNLEDVDPEQGHGDGRLIAAAPDVVVAAKALLAKLDDMTIYEFERGGDGDYREALRRALKQVEKYREP